MTTSDASRAKIMNKQKRIDRFELAFRALTIEKVFNKPSIGLASLFQKLVRLRAADHQGNCACITCGKVANWKEVDAGHYVGRNNKATILDPRNVHPQCKRCNDWGAGEKARYRDALISRYGEEVVSELETKTLPKNHVWDRRKLAELKVEFLDEIKELERRFE